ncbi:YkvA family protein, partial [Roseibium sp.]|uniref:YkvA family protein n=1 Tax=Roseibium sp. TaxID=1936156 RepID=UPI003D151EC5
NWDLRKWAGLVKRDIHALYLAARDPRVPWYVKGLALVVAAYAVSPVDLIPDFIPVIGYLDDLVLLPLGIYAVVKLVPPEVMADCRRRAEKAADKPVSRGAAFAVVVLWGALATAGLYWLAGMVRD